MRCGFTGATERREKSKVNGIEVGINEELHCRMRSVVFSMRGRESWVSMSRRLKSVRRRVSWMEN